eukprot:757478-Hanusia_phi.AAC.2
MRRNTQVAPNSSMGVLHSFLDDLRNMRSNAMVIIGVIFFAILIAFHSDKMLTGEPKSRGRSQRQVHRSSAVPIKDIEAITAHLLQHHHGVSTAAEQAKAALKRQSIVRKVWEDHPKEVYGKPVRYVTEVQSYFCMLLCCCRSVVLSLSWYTCIDRSLTRLDLPPNGTFASQKKNLNQLHKYYACSKYADARVNTCFYQVTRPRPRPRPPFSRDVRFIFSHLLSSL